MEAVPSTGDNAALEKRIRKLIEKKRPGTNIKSLHVFDVKKN